MADWPAGGLQADPINADALTEQPTMSNEAVILSGIQGAGKSTFCRQRYWDSHLRLNYDMLRTRHREALLLAACLAAKQNLVVDATNPTAAERARYIVPCKLAGFRLIGIQFRIATPAALARNAQRGGRARVPDKAIWSTAARLEPLSFAEGFDELWWADASETGVVLTPQTPLRADP